MEISDARNAVTWEKIFVKKFLNQQQMIHAWGPVGEGTWHKTLQQLYLQISELGEDISSDLF